MRQTGLLSFCTDWLNGILYCLEKPLMMKKLTIWLAVLIFCSCVQPTEQNEKFISIGKLPIEEISSSRVSAQEYRDLEVNRISREGEFWYEFGIYGYENDTLQKFTPFFQSTEVVYDKASYYWENDTSVIIRLFSSESKEAIKFRLSGDLINELGTGKSNLKVMDKNDL